MATFDQKPLMYLKKLTYRRSKSLVYRPPAVRSSLQVITGQRCRHFSADVNIIPTGKYYYHFKRLHLSLHCILKLSFYFLEHKALYRLQLYMPLWNLNQYECITFPCPKTLKLCILISLSPRLTHHQYRWDATNHYSCFQNCFFCIRQITTTTVLLSTILGPGISSLKGPPPSTKLYDVKVTCVETLF